eukprot:TRINITY_DN33492_c0_g1_i1.p1 TRINITY_DN33492_c0_g1~~TRINITY_DN33492_c0_g1_i1.p1  ORF type:complete len:754 (-),score=143.56 TRINITY_DN33492_c0_g1_i1:162-2423(-)
MLKESLLPSGESSSSGGWSFWLSKLPRLNPLVTIVLGMVLFAWHLKHNDSSEASWRQAWEQEGFLKELWSSFYKNVLSTYAWHPFFWTGFSNLFLSLFILGTMIFMPAFLDTFALIMFTMTAGGFYGQALGEHQKLFFEVMERPLAIMQGEDWRAHPREAFVGVMNWLFLPYLLIKVFYFFQYLQARPGSHGILCDIMLTVYAFLALWGNMCIICTIVTSAPFFVFLKFLATPFGRLVKGDVGELDMLQSVWVATVLYTLISLLAKVVDSEEEEDVPKPFHARLKERFGLQRKGNSPVDLFMRALSRNLTREGLETHGTQNISGLAVKQEHLVALTQGIQRQSWWEHLSSCFWFLLGKVCMADVLAPTNSDGTGVRASLGGSLLIAVEREHIVEQSLDSLMQEEAKNLLRPHLQVIFLGEEGLDMGGLTRDWFDSLASALVEGSEDPKGSSLLAASGDGTCSLRPLVSDASGRDLSDEKKMQLARFSGMGRFLAMAIVHRQPVPLPLSIIVCKYLLDKPVTARDVQQLDPDFYRGRVLQVQKEGGLEELNAALGEPLTFMSAATELQPTPHELLPGGEKKVVTETNKQEYVELLCEHYLCNGIRLELAYLLKGFWELIPQEALKMAALKPRELAVMITGTTHVEIDEWRTHVQINGADSPFVTMFFEVVEELSDEEQAQLIHFVTGSSRLPVGGFSSLSSPFTVSIFADRDVAMLPAAHTCMNAMEIPKYQTKKDLKEKLLLAINESEGFGFA